LQTYDNGINYLRGLKNKLEVLKISDNPFSKYNEVEYKQYAVAYLKDLKYLDYELIDEDFREKAREKYKDEIQDKDTLMNSKQGSGQNSGENKEDASRPVD